jgi:hypothetical protein
VVKDSCNSLDSWSKVLCGVSRYPLNQPTRAVRSLLSLRVVALFMRVLLLLTATASTAGELADPPTATASTAGALAAPPTATASTAGELAAPPTATASTAGRQLPLLLYRASFALFKNAKETCHQPQKIDIDKFVCLFLQIESQKTSHKGTGLSISR